MRFEGSTLRTLSPETIDRLNTPPVFEVGTPTVRPVEIEAGEQVEATMEFGLSNVGEGAGTFGVEHRHPDARGGSRDDSHRVGDARRRG